MHRADVLKSLSAEIPAERMHIDHELVGFEDRGDHVVASFENGRRIRADILLGADGIHTTEREGLFGPQKPHFTGCVCYRGLVPAKRVADLDIPVEAQIWMGPGNHFIHYYGRNRELPNFVAIIEQDSWTRESWTDPGDVAEAIAAFARWHPQVTSIIDAVDETFI
jgi:salicylate hydroxylase